jgi:hypothetical protein
MLTGCLGAIVFVAGASSAAVAQPPPAPDPNVVLRVSIVGVERPFRIGETIPLQLEFSSAVSERYQVNAATYDRSGRMEYERFTVSPSGGSVDPLAPRAFGMMGGLTGFQFLSAKPWSIRLNVNEWIRFTRPGTYRLTITSRRIEIKNPATVRGTSEVLVSGNPITLRIVAATPAWQTVTLRNAVATLNQAPPAGSPSDAYYRARSDALTSLRFLGTPAAIRELANRLRGNPIGSDDSICVMGLLSAPDKVVAREALEQAVDNPNRPVHDRLLSTLSGLDEAQNPPQWREARQRALERLVKALPNKRGDAVAISLMTAANAAWNFVPLPETTTNTLAQQLIARFDQLPVQQQNFLLESRWDKIGGPALLPLLRRYAGANTQIDRNGRDEYDRQQLAATALRRWYELDPASARPALLAEISRPDPRLGTRALGLLPDAVLPNVDVQLAERFAQSPSAHGASLIARYATGAVLDSVLATLDPHLGRWACDIQAPILAYALRVNRVLARPRIEKALASRESTGCYGELLTSIADVYYDSILEDLARSSLDDPAPRVRTSSIRLLGRFGSPSMEAVLSERYSKWIENVTGRELEVTPAFTERGTEQDAINEGANLLEALTTATSWVTRQDKLTKLLSMTRVPRLRQYLEFELNTWRELTITVNTRPGSTSIDGGVAQYEFQSMRVLQNKLEQFPAGTRFVLRVSGQDTQAVRAAEDTVSTFLRARGMAVVQPQ